MAYIVDIILIAIFAIAIIISAYKGFFRSLIDLAGSLVAVLTARVLSQTAAQAVYSTVLEGGIEKALISRLGEGAATDYTAQLEEILQSLPEGINGVLQMIGFDRQMLIDKISEANLNGNNLIESLMNSVVTPLVTAVVQVILFVILAIVLIIAVKILAVLLDKIIKKLPVIKGFNKTLGAVFGIFKGLIDVIIVSFVISVIVGFISNPQIVEAVEASAIVNAVSDVFSSLIADINI